MFLSPALLDLPKGQDGPDLVAKPAEAALAPQKAVKKVGNSRKRVEHRLAR